jgi:hypothetical protein
MIRIVGVPVVAGRKIQIKYPDVFYGDVHNAKSMLALSVEKHPRS